MHRKISIAVIFGGISGEHEVSLSSAASVMKALDPRRYKITPILIERSGRWVFKKGTASRRKGGQTAAKTQPSSPLAFLSAFDVVFPLIHGTGGEDGSLQGLLDLAGVPYVGSGVLGSAIGMDKAVQKKILERENLPVTPWLDFTDDVWRRRRHEILNDAIRRFGFPVFVKPANLGSSVGITKAHDRRELVAGVELALTYDLKVIVEKAVPQAREIECSVIGDAEPLTSVLGEVVPSNEFYDYEAKYINGRSTALIPAPLPPALAARIRNMAGRVFTVLEASGLARVDFLVSRARKPAVYVNEINTLPGFTSISMFPQLWAGSGLSFGRLIDKLVAMALTRGRKKSRLSRTYKPRQKRGETSL